MVSVTLFPLPCPTTPVLPKETEREREGEREREREREIDQNIRAKKQCFTFSSIKYR
jgi:hypothetical protein